MRTNALYCLSLAALCALAAPAQAGEPWHAGMSGGSADGYQAPPPPPAPGPAAQSLNCSVCYASLNSHYAPSDRQALKTVAASMPAITGYTAQESRNYFEATGKFVTGTGLDETAGARERELKRLLAIVKDGTYYYGNAVLNVGSGAWDCLTHATRLKEFLEEKTQGGGEYVYEIVNGWSDPRKYSAGNLVSANHYVVRAVSLKTGHSYICDGYTGSSVEREQDDTHIVFNDFEDCIYNKYSEMTLGDGFMRVVAQWTPVQKGRLAMNAKSGAGVCLSGAADWSFER